MKRNLDDCSLRSYLLRLKVARFFAAGSNDLPLWRSIRRYVLSRVLLAPGLRMGSQVRLDRSHGELGGRLVLGSNVDIGPRVILDTCGGLILEDESTLSMNALVLSHDHVVTSRAVPWRQQGKVPRPLRIRSDSWIGAGATVLGGVSEVGTGAIVGAASVVTRDVADYVVVVGNPARTVSSRE